MIITSGKLTLELDDKGSIASLISDERKFTADNCATVPFFNFRMYTPDGYKMLPLSTLDAGSFTASKRCGRISLTYSDFADYNITFTVKFKTSDEGKIAFDIDWENGGDMYLEFIEFSGILLANEFADNGGDLKLFWPMTEGCELDSPILRESSWKHYYPAEYPSRGWQGLYPGAVPMQFMACYDGKCGIYAASHDTEGMFKGIDFLPREDGVQILYRMFTAGMPNKKGKLGFPFVLASIGGDWMSAAEVYREFIETSDMKLPTPISEDDKLPEWYGDFPIVITYPVRGTKDVGDMTPNRLFPYENVLPYVESLKDRIGRELGVRVMILLMHWEGTAPWAPPFIWPPFGGEDMFREFVHKLHNTGDLIGIYASGLAWTDKSTLLPTYDMNQYRLDNELDKIMCMPPDGGKAFTYICQGPIRTGTDMCAACDKAKRIAIDEIKKAANAGVDYLQYFDQTLGGEPAVCYSTEHGHPPVPGKWQTKEMKKLTAKLFSEIPDKNIIIGCESAAAENFISDMRFNDLRFSCTYEFAKPVPAYAFVFHKYIVNFMGNQNGFSVDMPSDKNPHSMLFRLAYSFTAGDLLTLVIRDDGTIVWDWDCDWSVPQPDQENIVKLLSSLIALRKSEDGKKYLHYSKMIRAPKVEGGSFALHRTGGTDLIYDSILASAWEAPDGTKAAVIVNYLPEEQTFTYDGKEMTLPALSAVIEAM